MVALRNFDVVVAGTGVTGLSSALHLQKSGIDHIALSGPHLGSPTVSESAAGIACGGQSDNVTRIVVAHGIEVAHRLWEFGDKAFDAFEAWCQEEKIAFEKRSRFRIITSQHEYEESIKAIEHFNRMGFTDKKLVTERSSAHFIGMTERALAIQDEGQRAAWFCTKDFLRALKASTDKVTRISAIAAINVKNNLIELQLEDGSRARCHFLILATHLATNKLLPEFSDKLISISDQWSELEIPERQQHHFKSQRIVFSLNHNHEWGVVTPQNSLIYGGARYLRPLEGIEANTANADLKITRHLICKAEQTFLYSKGISSIKTISSLECRPYDELPLIGPISSTSKVLLATGFMGQGMTQGFFAGRCLADLLAHGYSEELPRQLWPERTRSL